MTVLITLTIAGTDTGPFDLYSDVDGYVSAFETGVSKAALQAGYSSSLVPNAATIIRVKSTGVCNNYVDIVLVTTTTTTTTVVPPTTTTTTTSPIAYNYYTFTPCAGGASVDYRSILALALGAVYSFAAYPPTVACYTITSITAAPNTNDLPTLYGPLTDCSDPNCVQL
jgi:hypothetical protein